MYRTPRGCYDGRKRPTFVLRCTVVHRDGLQDQPQFGSLTNTVEDILKVVGRPWGPTQAPQSTAEGRPMVMCFPVLCKGTGCAITRVSTMKATFRSQKRITKNASIVFTEFSS